MYGCKRGNWGETCDGACSSQCKNNNCKDYFNICQEGCIDTFYGPNCDIVCDEGCLHLACNDSTGFCTDGCVNGQFGTRCELSCVDVCIGGDCDRATGRCEWCSKEVLDYRCPSAGTLFVQLITKGSSDMTFQKSTSHYLLL